MCMHVYTVKLLCKLTAVHITRCEASEKLPSLKDAPYVPPEHTQNLDTLACVIESLTSRLDGVLEKPGRIDIDALVHSFID